MAVPGGAEHVGLRARTLHETGNWLADTDRSTAFNGVKGRLCLWRWPTACQHSRS